ncbi:MAG: MFS transporter [Bacilli bacterium]|nr:MFS transporter [Bacilli bacterium]
MAALLLAIIYLAFISLGLPDSLLGSAWPYMHLQINANVSLMGVLTMIIAGGTIISSLFSDKMTRKFGSWFIIVISIILTVVALIGFSFSTSFWMLCLFAIPYGFGAGAIDSTLNNYVALHYSSRSMSWLHCFWGIGTIISPYIMSYALSYHSSYQLGYRLVGIIQLVICAVVALSYPLWKKLKQINKDNEPNLNSLSFKEKFKIKGIFFVLFAFLAYCAFEATLIHWSATYVTKAHGVDEISAASYAPLFFIGMTISRFIFGFITNKLGDKNSIRVGISIVILGLIFLFIPTTNNIVYIVGLITIGLGCGPIYPCIIHSAPYNFGSENSAAVISLQMAFAYIGSTFIPPIYGLLINLVGAQIFPYFILFFVIIFIIMIELLNKKVKNNIPFNKSN